jgi:hypothetical protein
MCQVHVFSQQQLNIGILVACTIGVQTTMAQMSILALGDWGGSADPPFYTDVEVANANAMAGVMAQANPTPELGLLMGDNFYTHGIDCAGDPDPNCTTDSHSQRFVHTFEEVRGPAGICTLGKMVYHSLNPFQLCQGSL